MDRKHAFLNKEIDLADYLYAQAANIDYIDYVDDVVDENESLDTSGLDNAGGLEFQFLVQVISLVLLLNLKICL